MTRNGIGSSSISQESSRSPSHKSTSHRSKHRRKLTRMKSRYEDKYFDSSCSESPNQDEFQQQSISHDASYAESEYVKASTDGVSSQVPESVFGSNVEGRNSLKCLQPLAQAASYIHIAPLPLFCGRPDECPITHLSRFLKVCRANNAPCVEMMMRIFPVTLEQEAALWYDLNIEPYSSLTWEEIKLSFLQAYNRIDVADQLRTEFLMINQGNNEPVRSYFLRLQWILKQWPDHGLQDPLLKGIFIDGLKEDFRNWIIPQKPSSLNDALRLAFSYEQVQSIRGTRIKGSMKCGFCDGMHEEQACEIRERMRELWLKNKDKQLVVSTEKGRGQVASELVRSVSIGASSTADKNEVVAEKEEAGLLGCSKSQCQCSKHQCWKKKFERNNSLLFGKSNVE